ncbi:MAG: class I mannose-6-phosphate isomerase [Planctomycetales bacterium]|nr:class I mannose-6-phosphate isomerase [Planctomycetales bacterium]
MPLEDPLTFVPVFQQYLWGGRRLETVLHKPLGDAAQYAESWEVVDHGDEQSVVATGPQAGRSLRELLASHAGDLLGEAHSQSLGDLSVARFPLLFKFLDAQRVLSLQVHPNDEQAARLNPPDLGKTEAWVIVAAEPGAVVYAGLKAGVTRERLRIAMESGAGAECMHCFEPAAGDCVFIPAGVPHALGAGLLVAEIQQASNTTFRLHDWNRLGADGQPRPLHLEQGLAVIDYEYGPVTPQMAQPTADAGRERLVACDKFVLDRLRAGVHAIGGGRFHILAAIEGAVELRWNGQEQILTTGQTTLVPASVEADLKVASGDAGVLDMYLPDK